MQTSFYADAHYGRNRPWVWLLGLAILWIASSAFSPVRFINPTPAFEYILADGPGIPLMKRLQAFLSNFWMRSFVTPLLLFVGGLVLVQKVLRRRPLKALITIVHAYRWKRMGFAMGVYLAIAFLFWGTFVLTQKATYEPTLFEQLGLEPEEQSYSASFSLPPYFIAELFFVIIYYGCVELMFRGFVDQGTRYYVAKKWIARLVGAGIYGLWMLSPFLIAIGKVELTKELILVVFFGGFLIAFIFGFLLTYLCEHDNGLEAVLGIAIIHQLYFKFISEPYFVGTKIFSAYMDGESYPRALFVHSFFYIPTVIILLFFKTGLSRPEEKPAMADG